jgi:hypothetical protein
MRHSYMLVALLLTACATRLEVFGPHAAALSETDLAQLRQLRLPHYYRAISVNAVARDHVKIWAGNNTEKVPSLNFFDAFRYGTTWRLVIPAEHPPPAPGTVVVD